MTQQLVGDAPVATSASTNGDTSSAVKATAPITLPLLLTLALLTAVAPFATDLYLPAFPAMAADLDTASAGVQLSLTAFLIGAGVGQLIFGPVSDRVGRRGPLAVGVLLFLASSVAATLAPSVTVLVGLRLLQGLSGAAGMVIARAIIADRAHGTAAAHAQTMLMMVGGIAPVIAPLLGSFLAEPIGWRGTLGVVAGIGAVAAVATLLTVRESRPRGERSDRTSARAASGAGMSALRSRQYAGHAIAFAFAFAVMMAYISASPFLYQQLIGLSTIGYGIAFGFNALLIMATSALAARLTSTMPTARIAAIGLAVNLGAVVVLGVLAATGTPAWTLAMPLAVAIGALGLVFGSTTALALDAVPGSPGLASAVLGLGQFALAGIVAPLVSIGGEDTALPLAIVMVAASVVANATLHWARRGAATLDT
ncbi:multidrug effflux MFS transporter [Demequina capsici]|uniref:Multidrug effflux MFS transporter n=1 Tax=Demequina capsici TaxID=3075620 RepID=A0AA96JB53_9MICO|nr:multidrug effflux MFS transporter [Demequina sp. OYTSA14]WNM25411.1 multidrug effflux MFS transporter [Demequina sp. OYTSA14]